MKSAKKFLALVLTLAMCAGCLSGCAVVAENPDIAAPTSAPAATSTPAATPTPTLSPTPEPTLPPGVTATPTPTPGPTNTPTPALEPLPAMTTDNITLTYLNFDQDETTQYLAKKFMEKYPNITVLPTYAGTSGFNDLLLNMVAAGLTPDCFMFLGNCDFVLTNELVGDMTFYWENDPENYNLLPTINEQKVGYFGTNKKLGTPAKFFPDAVYLDMTVFEMLNVEMPAMDWSWEDMIETIKKTTMWEGTPDGKAYYGLACYHSMVTYYPIAASPTCMGEFGWDGSTFHMDAWAKGLQQYADLQNAGYVSPNRDTEEMGEWMGDPALWQGDTGHVAMMFEAFWTYMNLWDLETYTVDKNINFVPYVIPADYEVAEGEAWNSFGILDMAGISSGTQYPREAYELLKFMTWGIEGWNHRLDLYEDETILNAAGNPLKRDVMPAPITLDEGIWARYRKLFPTDEKRGPYWDFYFENCIRPVTWGSNVIPGFDTFIANAYSTVEGEVFGGASAFDYVDSLQEQANVANQQAMEANPYK